MGAWEHVPRQNRVTPFGDIVALPARGTLMGNRGCLHDAEDRIKRPYRLSAWIYCLLAFKGRRRAVMSPGKYTELFFLDEATALAAGHRPCFECQRARYVEFMACWGRANAALLGGEKLRAGVVDAVLQRERFGVGGSKVTYRARLGALPAGCFVEMDERAWMIGARGKQVELRAWAADGYAKSVSVAQDIEANVLTPESVVKTIAAGFAPRPYLTHGARGNRFGA